MTLLDDEVRLYYGQIDGLDPTLGLSPPSPATTKAASGDTTESNPNVEAATVLQSLSQQSGVPKHRRKKPTLNCKECVSRKTKCDRAHPSCLSCIRRHTPCLYSKDAIALNARGPHRPHRSRTGGHSRPIPKQGAQPAQPVSRHRSPAVREQTDFDGLDLVANWTTQQQKCSQRIMPADPPSPFNLYGMGSQHPFANYWTTTGGLAEVISVLGMKEEVDPYVDKYFENIDPLYPIVPQAALRLEHERFWALTDEEKCEYNPAQLALHLIIYALGAQYADSIMLDNQENTSEFYLSACHQSLCIFSYLNRCSIPAVQTMLLVSHLLLSNNRISDAWTFSGITQRQAYGLGLNRDPDFHYPNKSFAEKQLRCRLWEATMFQDVCLSLYLDMPPSTVHHDIEPSCLRDPVETPRQNTQPWDDVAPSIDAEPTLDRDITFLRTRWQYSSFVQTHICIPKSLQRPLCRDAAHKTQLIRTFRDMYQSWDRTFSDEDATRFEEFDDRLARQAISITTNYFYSLTLLCMATNDVTGVTSDVFAALDAAHEALSAFFALLRINPETVNTWCAAHTRAYSQATMIGTILSTQVKEQSAIKRDPRLMLARSNFERYLDVLLLARGSLSFEAIQTKRIVDLKALRSSINTAWTKLRDLEG